MSDIAVPEIDTEIAADIAFNPGYTLPTLPHDLNGEICEDSSDSGVRLWRPTLRSVGVQIAETDRLEIRRHVGQIPIFPWELDG